MQLDAADAGQDSGNGQSNLEIFQLTADLDDDADGFARLRVGVGRGDPRRDLADHVLARVSGDALETLAAATGQAADAAELFLVAPIEELMKRFNAAPKSEAGDSNGGTSAERGAE